MLDAGACGVEPTTIVDLTGPEAVLVRRIFQGFVEMESCTQLVQALRGEQLLVALVVELAVDLKCRLAGQHLPQLPEERN